MIYNELYETPAREARMTTTEGTRNALKLRCELHNIGDGTGGGAGSSGGVCPHTVLLGCMEKQETDAGTESGNGHGKWKIDPLSIICKSNTLANDSPRMLPCGTPETIKEGGRRRLSQTALCQVSSQPQPQYQTSRSYREAHYKPMNRRLS